MLSTITTTISHLYFLVEVLVFSSYPTDFCNYCHFQLHLPFYLWNCSSLNGVKDMVSYRMALNLSYDRVTGEGSGNVSSCNFDDSVETSAILVSLLIKDRTVLRS